MLLGGNEKDSAAPARVPLLAPRASREVLSAVATLRLLGRPLQEVTRWLLVDGFVPLLLLRDPTQSPFPAMPDYTAAT